MLTINNGILNYHTIQYDILSTVTNKQLPHVASGSGQQKLIYETISHILDERQQSKIGKNGVHRAET